MSLFMATIWEIVNNLTPASSAHFANRRSAVNRALSDQLAIVTGNPGSYWRVESWAPEGDMRLTVRSGPSANASIISDVSVLQKTLEDVSHL